MKLPAHLQHISPEILNHGLVCYLFGIIEGQSLEIENLKAQIQRVELTF